MGHSQNPNAFSPDKVGDIGREDFQIDAAIPFRPEPWQFMVGSYPEKCGSRFFFKTQAKTGFDFLVIRDCLGKFSLRFREEVNSHLP